MVKLVGGSIELLEEDLLSTAYLFTDASMVYWCSQSISRHIGKQQDCHDPPVAT